MERIMLNGKIVTLTVTQAELEYEGSITLDEELLEQAGILPGEQVHVLNKNNGERLITYTIKGERGSGICCLNGPAALKGKVGDKVMVVSFVHLDDSEAKDHKAKLVLVDDNNKVVSVKEH